MSVALESHAEGVVVPVRAQAGGRQNALRGEHQGMLRVSVTQVAEQGKANAALVDVLAGALGLRRGQFELLSGASSPQKRFLVRGITVDELATRIEQALAQ